jgi:tetratricopeptide (TPR) repeat protein
VKALETKGILPTAADYEATDLAHNSPETILEVARTFRFEEDSRWNARVGRVLREAGHYDTAESYIKRAIEIAKPDDNIFLPYTGLARVYAAQKKYTEAVQAADKGLQFAQTSSIFTQQDKTTFRNYWTTEMLKWHAETNDADSVLSLSKEIMKSFPEQYGSATLYVRTLVEKKQYETAMEVFRNASSEKLEAEGNTRLTAWTMAMMWQLCGDVDFFDVLVPPCRALGQLEFAKTTYLEAIKAVKKTDTYTSFFLEVDYGRLLFQEFKKPKQAAHIFEKVLDDAKGSRANSPIQKAKIIAIDLLCKIYVARALHGGKDSKEAASSMDKLNKLWTQELRSNSMPFVLDITVESFEEDVFCTTKNTTLYLASLYRIFGEPEKAHRLLKDHMQLGFDLLTNDDLEDDWIGYNKIADVLSRIGDDTGALAAYALVAPKYLPENDGETSLTAPGNATHEAAGDETHEALSDAACVPIGSAPHSGYSCDGECGTLAYWGLENFYCCIFCVDTCFCKDCYKLLMVDNLGFNVCGKNHEFLFIPEIEPFKKGKVPVGDGVMDQQEWLAKIRKEWEL